MFSNAFYIIIVFCTLFLGGAIVLHSVLLGDGQIGVAASILFGICAVAMGEFIRRNADK